MRAFLAISPDEQTLTAIADAQRRCHDAVDAVAPRARVTWARPEALHLTMRFFAAIDDELAMALRDRVAERLAGCEPVGVPLARIGGFPRLAAPRVVWIGPPEGWMDSPEGVRMTAIAQAIDHTCDVIRVTAEERRWSPHITLARVKDGERLVGNAVRKLHLPAPTAILRADHVALYKSDLSPGGARHTRLWEVPFLTTPPHPPIARRE